MKQLSANRFFVRPSQFFLAISLFAFSCTASAVDIRFSGFGDMIWGMGSGGPAEEDKLDLWELYGSDDFPLNSHEGFTTTGVDLVSIVDLTEETTFLAEVNFQTSRGSSSELGPDVERIFVNHAFSEALNVQMGLYFTPIGYHNRFLYSRAWLMDSTQVPDLFEEDLNLVPTHSSGIMIHGTKHFGDKGDSLNYAFNVANGRAVVPNAAVYARDPDSGNEITWLIEWTVPNFNESRIGLSGWTDQIHSVYLPNRGDVSTPVSQALDMDEVGFNPYVVIQTHKWTLLAEYVQSTRSDRGNTLPQKDYKMSGYTAELSYRAMDGALHPYIRYDVTEMEDGGDPYLELREGDGGLVRTFVPEVTIVMTGAAYDLNQHTRLKFELANNLDGIREENIVTFQLAFGF